MNRNRRRIAPLVLALVVLLPVPGEAQSRLNVNRSTDPLLSSFQWREIGPIGQGGRVDDVAVRLRERSQRQTKQ